MSFASVERVLVAYLATAPGIGGVSAQLPNDPPYPFVLITRLPVGGGNLYTARPLVDVEVFHPDRLTALDFAHNVIHPMMMALRGTAVGGVPIDFVHSPSDGFGWKDYQDPLLHRYLAEYVVESGIAAQP